MKKNETMKETLLSQLKPYPIALQEQKINELRASDNFTDIKKLSRAPKGEFCDNCGNLSTKYEPRICSWNDEITDVVSYAYCDFFGNKLMEEKKNEDCPCNYHYRKCFACLMQTEIKKENNNE